MLSLLIEAEVSGGALQIAGDHVPAESAFGEVIERGGSPSKRIGVLVGQCAGHPEPKVFRHLSHRRNDQERIIDWGLDPLANRRVRLSLIDIIRPQYVRQEQSVDFSLF